MPWLCFDELGCAQNDFEMKLPVSWARSIPEAQHTVVLTDDGNLFATGKGDFGRLGRGDTNDEVWGVLGATVAGGRGGVESVGISSFLVNYCT